MNLQRLIEQYVAFRQSLGERFQTNATHPPAFGRAIGAGPTSPTSAPSRSAPSWPGPGRSPSPGTASTAPCSASTATPSAVATSPQSPLPAVIPKRPPPFVPYIYSHEELRRLLAGDRLLPAPPQQLEPVTVRTILLLLYGTGLRVREAVDLNRADVDLDNSLLTVRQTKFCKTRLVPFGPQLGRALAQYATRRRRLVPAARRPRSSRRGRAPG